MYETLVCLKDVGVCMRRGDIASAFNSISAFELLLSQGSICQ